MSTTLDAASKQQLPTVLLLGSIVCRQTSESSLCLGKYQRGRKFGFTQGEDEEVVVGGLICSERHKYM